VLVNGKKTAPASEMRQALFFSIQFYLINQTSWSLAFSGGLPLTSNLLPKDRIAFVSNQQYSLRVPKTDPFYFA
jgi:hypothetical protein